MSIKALKKFHGEYHYMTAASWCFFFFFFFFAKDSQIHKLSIKINFFPWIQKIIYVPKLHRFNSPVKWISIWTWNEFPYDFSSFILQISVSLLHTRSLQNKRKQQLTLIVNVISLLRNNLNIDINTFNSINDGHQTSLCCNVWQCVWWTC